MKKIVIPAILFLLLAFWATPAYASGVPSLPHAFYGSVTINGDAAPNDTQVSATVDNGTVTPTQNPVTTVGGSYGINSPKLLVQGDSLSGDVTFYVNGVVMEGATATFEVGGGPTEMKLDLVITDKSITGKVKETVSAGQTDYVIDASDIADTTITVDTTAEVTITVKKYYSNPHPDVTLPAEMLPRYIDIEVDNFDAIVWPMYVEQTYTDAEVAGLDESSLGMYYFKAGAWHKCSDTGVNTTANYIWANMAEDELSGSPIAIGGTVPPAPPAPPEGDGVGAPPAIYVETNLFGITASFRISSAGEILKTIEATSADGMLTTIIPKGTIALDKDGKRLKSLQAVVDESPPDLPEDAYIIGLAYNFGPDGATFDPAITSTWSYDPEALPEGVAEEDLVLAYYDEETGKWVEIECVVDTENNVITASVSHFTTFAIIGVITPHLPPVPAVFSLSNLRIEPAEVEIGEAITITVSVANTGGTKGTYEVVLKINEVVVEKKTVTVAAGSSEIITFFVTREEAGSYSVTMDGLSASFTVIAPAPLPPEEEKVVPPEEEEIVPPAPAPVKPNWPLIGGIIGGCVLVGLLVFFLVRRRAY